MRVIFLLAMVVCAAHAGKPAPKDEKKGDASAEAPSGSAGGSGSSDISKLGAKGDGKTDSTKALNDAWAAACGKEGAQTLMIPKGDYLAGPLNFSGPCKGSVTIQLDGNLLGTTDLSQYKGNWIEIEHVDNLVITGKGTLDGQGKQVWDNNKCAQKYDCKILPNVSTLMTIIVASPPGRPIYSS